MIVTKALRKVVKLKTYMLILNCCINVLSHRNRFEYWNTVLLNISGDNLLAQKNQHLNNQSSLKNNMQIISFFSVLLKALCENIGAILQFNKAIMKTKLKTLQQKFQPKLVKSPNFLNPKICRNIAPKTICKWDKLRAGAFIRGL